MKYKGVEVLFNEEDRELFESRSWYVSSHGYLVNKSKRHGAVYFHRLVMGNPDGMLVDHVNRNTLDNRRENLRVCTKAENQRNHKRNNRNSSGYSGVYFHNRNKNWCAQITYNYATKHLGSFISAEEAAKAYDVAAKKLHGEFATLNFPEKA
jgi:hypothetical protein